MRRLRAEFEALGILSGKPSSFIVGADIREFEQLDTEAKVIEGITPVLAMLDQIEAAQGTGSRAVSMVHAWVAVAWSWRLPATTAWPRVSDATRVGFPEVKLGIFPWL